MPPSLAPNFKPGPDAHKHIVVIPSWYDAGRGSGGGYFRDQALALQAAGHRVAILVPQIYSRRDIGAGRAPVSPALTVEDDGVEVYRMARPVLLPRMPYRNALLWSRCGLRLFAAYVERNGIPDLVHAQSCLNAGVLAAAVRRRYGLPFILTEHSTGFDQQRLRWWERDLIRRVAAKAAARIAVSPHLAGLLQAQFGGVWHYVPNILNQAFVEEPVPQRRHEGFAFVCAARMSPVKNHPLLLHAFADAFAGDTEVRLVLAGDGPLRRDLEQLCRDRGIARQVVFCGTLPAEQLRDVMAACDAFVLASDVESFGVVVIEAQAVGLPVVCTASGGPDHLIGEADGLLAPVGDRARLAAALSEIRSQADRYDRAAIRARALRTYGPQAFADAFAALAP